MQNIWTRVKNAHDCEDVVITVGTGQISSDEEDSMGLIGEHDYAVLKLDDSSGPRKLLLCNPWRNGPELKMTEWPVSQSDSISLSAAEASDTTKLNRSEDMGPGLLWVSLEDVAQTFESMYLNWNPSLFRYRQDHHFRWDIPPACFLATLAKNPQFCVTVPSGGLVWILISRHFVDGSLE